MAVNNFLYLLTGVLAFSFLSGCSCNEEYVPKPRGFFRIDFPEKKYKKYDKECPFQFEYPEYSEITFDHARGAEPCWLNLEFATFKATLHLSYKSINNNLRQYTEDSRTLAMKHTVKAEEINEKPFITQNKMFGVMYDIVGNTASSVQFYMTDSTAHFLRASLYFNVIPQADSLAPVISFINKDIEHFINTFQWKKNSERKN